VVTTAWLLDRVTELVVYSRIRAVKINIEFHKAKRWTFLMPLLVQVSGPLKEKATANAMALNTL
jgi:hypothetical protein